MLFYKSAFANKGMVGSEQPEMSAEKIVLDHSRACPICRHAALPAAAVRAETPAEEQPPLSLANYWRHLLKKSCFFTFHRCANCHLLYSPDYFSEKTLAELYSSMDDNVHSGDAALSEATQVSYVDAIARYTKRAANYLEIGPDIGALTRRAKTRFGVETAYLVEPNRRSWPQLQSIFAADGGRITSSLSEQEDAVPDQSLDLAVGVHVFDHLLHPSDTMTWIARKMRPKGVVAIVVHNEGSLLARVLGRRWPAYCLQHPQLYNPQTLKNALATHGFRPEAVIQTVNDFPLGYLMSHAIFALTKVRISLEFLTLPVRLRLGNMMVIATRDA